MKKEEIEEIVENKLESKNKEIKKERKAVIISTIICLILFIVAIAVYLLYLKKPQYKIKINTNGGTITRDIVIKNNTIEKLPKITPPEGKELVTWVNKKKEAVRENLKLNGDDTLTPIFEDENRETVTLKYVSGTDEIIPDIKITKGSELILPAKPNKYKNWSFLYWVDKDEYLVLLGTRIYEDMTIYAYWWKPGVGGTSKETATISFDAGTEEKFDDLNLHIGAKYVFVTPTIPNGNKVFRGWLDDNNNLLDKDSKVKKSMTLKANWKDPYTCPDNCIPSDDGKVCFKDTYVDPSKEEVCPGKEYMGYCVDTSKYECGRQCASGYPFGNDELDYEINGEGCCVKKIDKVEKYTCPEGYTKEGEKCKKTETINCTPN